MTLIAANWKMHGTRASLLALANRIQTQTAELGNSIEIAVFPPFVYLEAIAQALQASSIGWGAQNVSSQSQGAFTGEVAAHMLADVACRYVIVGHSERRLLYGESDQTVAQKFAQVQQAGIRPILCVGETLEQYQAGETFTIVEQQLQAILDLPAGIQSLQQAVIAYEPVWAIGTGLTAQPEQAQAVHAFLRQTLAEHDANSAKSLLILYGGSVKSNNITSLLTMPDINGALVGGAALDADEFSQLCKLAAMMP